MKYTVNQLSKKFGITIRTIHWYDKKGILKPAYIGKNGYRYYQEQQVNTLKIIVKLKSAEFNLNEIKEILNLIKTQPNNILEQILFFKSIGLTFQTILTVLNSNSKNKILTLEKYKSKLKTDINQKQQLVTTIDNILRTEHNNAE